MAQEKQQEHTTGLTSNEVEHLLNDYLSTIQLNDPDKHTSLWSREYTGKFTFRSLPIHLDFHIDLLNNNVQDSLGRYIINEIKKADGYYEIRSAYQQSDPYQKAQDSTENLMVHYLVKEDGSWVFADPAELLARDWLHYESRYFNFYYPPQLEISKYMYEIEYLDLETEKLLKLFHHELNSKIPYYKTLSVDDCGRLAYCFPANGLCNRSEAPEVDPWVDKIVSVTFCNPHEVVHAITALAGIPDINTLFLEGIAVALEGTSWLSKEYSFSKAKKIINSSEYLHPVELFDDDVFLEHSSVTYHLSGSFVNYLLQKYGIKRYLKFCSNFTETKNLDQSLVQCFHGTMEKHTSDWKKFVLEEQELIQPGYTIPSDVIPIFDLSDLVGDDNGAGKYNYPLQPGFKSGMFDITNFSLWETSDSLYFKVKMRSIAEPVYNSETEETFTACLYIGLDRSIYKPSMLMPSYCGFKFVNMEGFDLLIMLGRGIALRNGVRKIVFESDPTAQFGNNNTGEYCFSFPKSFIGIPDTSWKIFVGAGLQKDYGLNLTSTHPLEMNQQPSEFTGGKGTDEKGLPRFYDVLLPDSIDQQKVFQNCKIPMIRIPIYP
nr:hypothetical protein [Bacteroidota bacterium]